MVSRESQYDCRHKTEQTPQDEFVDYYEVLQISPNADQETIYRVYRIMAARFHPDNPETGDSERFLRLKEAYEVLKDPQKRAEYSATHQSREPEPLPVFELKEFVEGIEGEANRRLGVLCLLYNQRRSSPDRPGLSLLDLETLMSFPREYLTFTIWYLKSKSYIRTEDNSDCVLTAEGVDYVEAGLSSNKIIKKLLKAPADHSAGQRAADHPKTCTAGAR